MDMGADFRMVLMHPVIICGDRASADVGIFVDMRISHIAEMRHFRPLIYNRLFHFHICPRFCMRAKRIAGAKVRPWADHSTLPYTGIFCTGTLNHSTLINLGIDKGSIRADHSMRRYGS